MAVTSVWDDQGTLSITEISPGNVMTVTNQIGNSALPVAWSPDGTQLAYSTRTEHGTTPLPFNGSRLWLADASGNNSREVFRTDRGDPHPEPEPGTDTKGTGRGDKAEYLYSFGGHTNTIRISGIDDYPAPVRVNIYVAGKFVFEMDWVSGDDARRQIS